MAENGNGNGVKGWAGLLVGPGAAAAIGAYAIYFLLTTGAASLRDNSAAARDDAASISKLADAISASTAAVKETNTANRLEHHRELSMTLYTCKEAAISAARATGKAGTDCDDYYRGLFMPPTDEEGRK